MVAWCVSVYVCVGLGGGGGSGGGGGGGGGQSLGCTEGGTTIAT